MYLRYSAHLPFFHREQEEVTAMQSDAQHQGDTKQPPNSQRNQRSTTRSSLQSHTHDPPPRLKHRQRNEATEPVQEDKPEIVKKDRNNLDSRSNTNTVGISATSGGGAAITKVKEPPGFGPKHNATSVNTCDWPDLMALTIEARDMSKQPPNVVTAAKRVLPQYVQPPASSYNPLEPSQFPPLSTQSFNSNLALLGQPSTDQTDTNTNTSSSLGIPPGFVSPQWQEIQQDPIYMSPIPTDTSAVGSTRNKEERVIEQVREALDYDREKFNYFRNLSGWYRNSEITVQEYVVRCRQLFGESTWMKVGPQLAQVMPIEGKRNELIKNIVPNSSDFIPLSAFPQPGHATTTLHVSHSAPALHNNHSRWPRENTSVPNWQSECEYPALHSESTNRMIRPPRLPHSWKARVRV